MMKMKKLKKRLFSTVLACLTAASMLPLTAMAEGEGGFGGYDSPHSYDSNNLGTYEEGHLYHIDVRVAGTFTYDYSTTAGDSSTAVTVGKVWSDSETVDHSGDSVTIALLGEDNSTITTVTLNEENGWSYTYRGDAAVTNVEETSYSVVNGESYTSSVSDPPDIDEEGGTESSDSGTGEIEVTEITSVTYVNTSGETVELPGSYYTLNDYTESDDYSAEFFLNADYRQLSDLGTSTTITVTFNYKITKLDGTTLTDPIEKTGASFTIGISGLEDDNNTCARKNYKTTEAGIDVEVSSEDISNDTNNLLTVVKYIVTNSPSEPNDNDGSDGDDNGEEESNEPDDNDDDDDNTTDTTPTVTEETTETTTTTTTTTTTESTTTTTTASACLAIIKEDADTGAYLEGAVYALYSASDDSLIGYYATNEEGWLSTYPMSSGTYYFIETQAPEGYVLDETPVYVTLDASSGETLVTIVTNTAEEGEVLSEAVEPTEPDEPDDPDDGVVLGESRGAGTGDDSDLLFWLILMLAAGAGIGGVVLTTRRNHI